MNKILPHHYFFKEFLQLLLEAERQDQINLSTNGEVKLAKEIINFFGQGVMLKIRDDDRIYEITKQFVTEHVETCFAEMRLIRISYYQDKLIELNEKVINLIAHLIIKGAFPQDFEDLPKASDFYHLVDFSKLSKSELTTIQTLYAEALDREEMQLRHEMTLVARSYEKLLPRVMFVVKPSIKTSKIAKSYHLSSTSEILNWIENTFDEDHALYCIFKHIRDYYRVIRNVDHHHMDFEWDTKNNLVKFADDSGPVEINVHEFQNRRRHLTYFCEYGIRGILTAFCERDEGKISNKVFDQYLKMFPDNATLSKEQVTYYPVN